MLDFALEYELALLAAIALLVAWLMGRSVCKSHEHQIRSDLNKQQRENERLETTIARLDKDLHDAYDATKTEQQKFLDIRNQRELESLAHENLKKSHTQNLQELQRLESSQIQLAELNKHHNEQTAEYLGLQNTLHQTQVQLQESHNLSKQQKHELERFRQDNERLATDYDGQVRTITRLQNTLAKTEDNLREQTKTIQDLQHQLAMEKTRSQQLAMAYEEQANTTTALQKSLKEAQQLLEETRLGHEKLQRGLKQAQQENDVLKARVTSYEILSTIR